MSVRAQKMRTPVCDICQGTAPWVETSAQDLSVGASLWRQNCLGMWETWSNIQVLEGTLHFELVKCYLKVMSQFFLQERSTSLVAPRIPGIFV